MTCSLYQVGAGGWPKALLATAVGFFMAGQSVSAAHAEQSREYVVSWFAQATHSEDGDCSGGVHPPLEEVYFRYLEGLGLSPQRIREIKTSYLEGRRDRELGQLMMMRGRINGEPVNPFTQPASVMDLHLPGLDGKFGYGFDLDGKGASDPKSFEDPQTHQKGVDHQLYRALGCARSFRGSLEDSPTYWSWAWGQLVSSQPAWLVRITGDDLSADGPVTVTFGRALEHLRLNGDSSPRANMAYRFDPDPRSVNVFKGEIKNGIVSVAGKETFSLLQNPLVAPELTLRDFHLRLQVDEDKKVHAILGGYQPWEDIYWGFGNLGIGGESQVIGDAAQLYYLLKRYADGDPDPVTGQNMSISAAYYIEAVPAFTDLPPPSATTQTAARSE